MTLQSAVKVKYKQLKRWPMHCLIRNLLQWQPMSCPECGYTVIIAGMRRLAPVAAANLRLISKMLHDNLSELILVFDCDPDDIPLCLHGVVEEIKSEIPVRLIGYNPKQLKIAKFIDWGWVYSWLSWCIGIANARTQYVLLHDLDAMPISDDIFEHLYKSIKESHAQFQGILPYHGNGIDESMDIVTTFEMMMDAAYVRQTFHPFDVFNRAAVVNGRYVDFDTFLYMQWKSGKRCLASINETSLVHPTQLICQYTNFVSGRDSMAQSPHSLIILAYFLHIGGESGPLKIMTRELINPDKKSVTFAKRALRVDHLAPKSWAWMEKQIRRLEQAMFGKTRPEVEEFLIGIIERASDQRTVGTEVGPNAVAAT